MNWPTDGREDLHTEFKRCEALRNPAAIAREVVAFLNAEGGEIWIGVAERDGAFVEAEPIADASGEVARLQNALVDRIEPSPTIGRDVIVSAVPFPDDTSKAVIRIETMPGRNGPYAVLHQGARLYLRRTGSRLAPMTREDLARAFGARSEREDDLERVERWVLHRVAPEEHPGVGGEPRFAGLRVAVRPILDLRLGIARADVEPLLRAPQKTGNRRFGWNFTDDRGDLRPFQESGGERGFELGDSASYQHTRVMRSGGITFQARLERLHWQGPDDALWPLALLEFPASVARLARMLYLSAARLPTAVVLGLGLLGIRGQTLKPHSPMAIGYLMHEARRYEQADDFLANPVVATWTELESAPDRCAVRLVRQVYESFGYAEEEIPREYDDAKGILAFQV